MAWIVIDDKDAGGLRDEMRQKMQWRGNRGAHGMRGGENAEEAYRRGYEHGFRDHEAEMGGEEHEARLRGSRYGQ